MTDKKNEPGFPVDGGADEKIDYLANKISQARLVESDRKLSGEPVWRIEQGGTISISAAQIRPVRPQGCPLGFVKSLEARIRRLLLRFR